MNFNKTTLIKAQQAQVFGLFRILTISVSSYGICIAIVDGDQHITGCDNGGIVDSSMIKILELIDAKLLKTMETEPFEEMQFSDIY